MHEPTPEFQRYLEWQVATALRRQERFARPSASGSAAYLRAAIVLLSVLLGAGGVTAAGRIQQNQEKQVLAVQQQGELQLAEMQVSVAQKNLEETKKRADLGVAPSDDLTAAEQLLRNAMLQLQRVKLNLEEVQQSGRALQDDVTAPLVNARDFVLERLELDKQVIATAAAVAEARLKMMQKRFEAGLTPHLELLEAQSELLRQMNELKAIEDKMALRQKFIAGGISASDATRQRLLIAAQNQLGEAQASLDLAVKRSAELQKQMQLGIASNLDALKSQLDVLVRQQDIDRLRERLKILEKGGPLPDGRR